MYLKSYWEFKDFDELKARQLGKETNLSPLVARLLVQRGIDTNKRVQKFLYSELSDVSNPGELGGVQAAVVRIEKALQKNEKIVIYGDYDVDGICSIVLLKSCFVRLGYAVDYYVPGRFTEGYGLNLEAVGKLGDQGYSLIITVDCGIKSVEEIKDASELGVDVIVTDHHTPGDELPEAAAIINPKIDGNENNRDLAGVGVAYKLAQALCSSRGVDLDEYEWLDLVAMATIADIVPMTGDNRIFVKYGLQRIQKTKRIGLQALIKACGLEGKPLFTTHIGFALAPRLNSAGRLRSAEISIELLLATDEKEAERLARELGDMNIERRAIEDNIYAEAILQVEKENMLNDRVLVLAGENWHQGVIGIVCSRLSEKYNRPSILISWDGETGRGSGRSKKGFDLYEAMENCSQYLIQFGGHKMAAGLSIRKSDYEHFRQMINAWSQDNYTAEELKRRQIIDLEVDIEDINQALFDDLGRLQPCGEGNPSPVLALRNEAVYSSALVGQGHFKSKVGSKKLAAIAFNRADFINFPTGTCYHDQVFELTENEFRGQRNLQLKIKDMKPSYRPDKELNSSKFSAGMVRAVEKSLLEIEEGRLVLYICPTYRNLFRQVKVLQSFFRADIIAELHGKLPGMKRKAYEDEFIKGKNKIYVITLPYLYYFLEKNQLPAKLRFIVQAWPDTIEHSLLYWIRDCEIETIDEMAKTAEWVINPPYTHNIGQTLVYANRSKTIQNILERCPASKVEAGLSDINDRRKIRQEYWQTRSRVLVTDGAYSGCNTYDKNFNQVLFADIPYSLFEARLVLEQLKEDCATAGVLFDKKDISFNWNYLSRMYPEVETVNTVLECFRQNGENPIRTDIKDIAEMVGKYVECDFKAFDLLPVLYIMVDLGLCQIKKKGNIIEIKINDVENAQSNLALSPYYLEGKYEKQAFTNLLDDLNKILIW